MINAIQVALQGLMNASKKVDEAASNIVKAGAQASSSPDSDNAFDLDFSEQAVQMMQAKTEYKANLGVLKTATALEDELLKAFDKKV